MPTAAKSEVKLSLTEQIVKLVASHGGSLPAAQVGEFYAKHAAGQGKLRDFCAKHSDVLVFVPDKGSGTVKLTKKGKLLTAQKGSKLQSQSVTRTTSQKTDVQPSVAEQLVAHAVSNGGSFSASTIGQFYAKHPGVLAAIGKGNLLEFCKKHSDILKFVPNGSGGTVAVTSKGKLLITANKLAHHVASCGGTLPANKMNDFYAKYPEFQATVEAEKLRKFCEDHSDILQFIPNRGPGTVHVAVQRKKPDDLPVPPASLGVHAPSPKELRGAGVSATQKPAGHVACSDVRDENPVVLSLAAWLAEKATTQAPAVLSSDWSHKGQADPWGEYAHLEPLEATSDKSTSASSASKASHVQSGSGEARRQIGMLGTEGTALPASLPGHAPSLTGSPAKKLAGQEACGRFRDEEPAALPAAAVRAEETTPPAYLSADPWHTRQADPWGGHASLQPSKATSNNSTSASFADESPHVHNASASSREQPCRPGTEGTSDVAQPHTTLLLPSQENDPGLFDIFDDARVFSSMINDVHAKKVRAAVALAEWQEGLEIMDARLKKMWRLMEVERAQVKQREVAVAEREQRLAKEEEAARSEDFEKKSSQDGEPTSPDGLIDGGEATSSCTNASNDCSTMVSSEKVTRDEAGDKIREEPLWKPYTDPATGRTWLWNTETGTCMWDYSGQ